ncbi:MAG: T9SS type A sorting domain-containing protein [Saprospiraceae bacterium]
MERNIILSLLVLVGCFNLNGQSNPFEYTPSTTCEDAPLVCFLDGYSNQTEGYNSIDQPSTFCGSIQNNQWLAFIPSTTDLTIDLMVGNCEGLALKTGFQAHVYSVCGAPWSTASNCIFDGAPNTTEQLIMTNLTIGNTYYLMIDGRSGDKCNYTLSVTAGSTQSSGATLLADAGDDVLFDCLTQEVTLDGSNSIFGASDSIAWYNNNLLYISDSIAFTTTQSGTYYLVIQEQGGEICPSIDTINVLSFDDILPSPFLFPIIEIFTDTIGQTVFLDAVNSSGIDSNYIFSWTTDDGIILSHADSLYPLISSSGVYELEITHPETGCTITNQVVVNIIEPVSVFSPTKNTLNIEITPTITNDEVQVNYVLEKINTVSMQIYNVGGILLLDINFGKKPTGEHLEHLNLKNFTAGMYFIFIKTEEGSAVRKVVKR